jgi:hypothetical protein
LRVQCYDHYFGPIFVENGVFLENQCYDLLWHKVAVNKGNIFRRNYFKIRNIDPRSGGSAGLLSPLLPTTDRSHCACFFSLLRDKFRASPDYKMTVAQLEEAVADWETLVTLDTR